MAGCLVVVNNAQTEAAQFLVEVDARTVAAAVDKGWTIVLLARYDFFAVAESDKYLLAADECVARFGRKLRGWTSGSCTKVCPILGDHEVLFDNCKWEAQGEQLTLEAVRRQRQPI
ncbi:hypothetical protein P3T76_014298 [Phytophthora citrophthora]|uniref:Uncharacterized protein n=1 Tax=Phytophthora citrophthora TaxID=4793 RepID=A0AAD9G166_9STRA|nr:hypothetical protein P3T76_014298 [Phytophthora citrophthora]